MARDFKLQFVYTAVTAGAGVQGVAVSQPSGELANSQATINLYNGSAGTSVAGAITSNTLAYTGYRNTRQATTFADWIAGNEVSAIANDPALWGNTSTDALIMRSNLNWVVPAAATAVLENGAFITVQGAFDNGSGSADANSWSPIAGNVPLATPIATLSTSAAVASSTTPELTTNLPHNLMVGDGVVLYTVDGLTGITAKTIYRVQAVTSPTTFTVRGALGAVLGSAASGTPSAAHPLYRVTGFNGLGRLVHVPLVESIRPYLRVVFSYSTANLVATSALQVVLSRTCLITGRESSATI